jgi:hypothetical protein
MTTRLLILLLLIGHFASAQMPYSTPAANVAKKRYAAENYFSELSALFDLSTLQGEEIYFPKRNEVKPGVPDSVAPLLSMTTFAATDLQQLISRSQRAQLQAVRPFDDWAFVGGAVLPRTRIYDPATKHYTYLYQPEVRLRRQTRSIMVYTPYEAVEDRFFKILSCSDSATNGVMGYINFLLEDDSGVQLRWVVHTRELPASPAYLKHQLAKIKNKYFDSYLYVWGDEWTSTKRCYNLLTSLKFDLTHHKRWHVTEFTFLRGVVGQYGLPVLIAESDDHQKIAIALSAANNTASDLPTLRDFMTAAAYYAELAKVKQRQDSAVAEVAEAAINQALEGAERLKMLQKKFGQATGQLLFTGVLELGMSPDMCRAAWGEPFLVGKAIQGSGKVEMWRYGINRWLRFTNGALSAFSE